jgi:DNA-binding CsgD family transcriptional regulator
VEVIRLQDEFRRGAQRRDPAELAEIIHGKEAVHERVNQLWKAAHEEVLVFDRPPYAVGFSDLPELSPDLAVRTIYSKETLDWPGALDALAAFAERGEEARFLPTVPMKLNIFDRRVGLLPLAEEGGAVEGAIAVQPSHLLDALLVLWETFWERAFALSFGASAFRPTDQTPPLEPDDARLAALLLSGSKSEAIARQMNIGLSTVERRIKRLMQLLGVESRVQIGYELARRNFSSKAIAGGAADRLDARQDE